MTESSGQEECPAAVPYPGAATLNKDVPLLVVWHRRDLHCQGRAAGHSPLAVVRDFAVDVKDTVAAWSPLANRSHR